jgi:hypothetical protein
MFRAGAALPTGEFVNLVPVWFYSFSAVAYAISALISLLITYFSFKSYRSTNKNLYLVLGISFLILTAAYSALTFTSIYTYFYQDFFRGFLSLNLVNNRGFNIYYILSLVAYFLLDILYLPKKFKKGFRILFVPLWYVDLSSFHIISLALLSFVVLRTAMNFSKLKTLNSFLVFFCFSMIALSHVSMIVLTFDLMSYLLAHAVLAIGFLSILIMLIRVNYNGRKKK